MIKWFKKDHVDKSNTEKETLENNIEQSEPFEKNEGFFSRLKKSLGKTRSQLGAGLSRVLLGKKEIDTQVLDEIETILLSADIGLQTTQEILKNLTDSVSRKEVSDGEAVFEKLTIELKEILSKSEKPLVFPEDVKPFVILFVGMNGAGKTTTIGKLAKKFQQDNKSIMLAAGDTFRAAAIEQLQVWGERNNVPVIAQHKGADSASVIFDAYNAAKSRNIDILIADTAGRLHTQSHLMDELKKVKRVLQKINPEAPHEIMLVLDASIGQNALNQAKEFHEAIGLSGITMTKLDGTAKGGILFAVAKELDLPIRYIGLGEKVEDLKEFESASFVEAIF